MSGGGGDSILSCANCGKGEEESNKLKKCSACLSVKYCSAACQKAHRPQHKKACKKRAAELHDEKLFKEPPPPEECPICFLTLPCTSQTIFKSCCGKTICNGCIYAMMVSEGGGYLCPFCRMPPLPPNSDEENIKRLNKLMNKGNANAYYMLAGYYAQGMKGLPQNWEKANNLFLKAGEHGYSDGYYNLGIAYDQGRGVEVDKKKANHYFELAAMNGHVEARYGLGVVKGGKDRNYHRAYKHFIIAARVGHEKSLDAVKIGFKDGLVTKDEYANTLRAYQKIQDEMKSDMRDKAKDGLLLIV